MSYPIPTLSELIERLQSDIQSNFILNNALNQQPCDAHLTQVTLPLRYSMVTILAHALAGAAYGLYGYIEHLSHQIIIDTADNNYLERWGSIWGIERKSALPAKGNVIFFGQEGSCISAHTLLTRHDGIEFVTEKEVRINQGAAEVSVHCLSAGSLSNTSENTYLNLISPLSGISSTVKLTKGLQGGCDIESGDSLRDRILQRIHMLPCGGAQHDYSIWARSIAGVDKVWVYPNYFGGGSVGVMILMEQNQLPTAEIVSAVQALMDEKRPVTAQVMVFSPQFIKVDVTLQVPSLLCAAEKAKVEAAVKNWFTQNIKPQIKFVFSQLQNTIALTTRITDIEIISPTTTLTCAKNELLQLGNIIWKDAS